MLSPERLSALPEPEPEVGLPEEDINAEVATGEGRRQARCGDSFA